jgi:hypothetical protein
MDQNSLPMVPDLEVFPPLVRYLLLGALALFVGTFVLFVLIGVLST